MFQKHLRFIVWPFKSCKSFYLYRRDFLNGSFAASFLFYHLPIHQVGSQVGRFGKYQSLMLRYLFLRQLKLSLKTSSALMDKIVLEIDDTQIWVSNWVRLSFKATIGRLIKMEMLLNACCNNNNDDDENNSIIRSFNNSNNDAMRTTTTAATRTTRTTIAGATTTATTTTTRTTTTTPTRR